MKWELEHALIEAAKAATTFAAAVDRMAKTQEEYLRVREAELELAQDRWARERRHGG